eukprot:82259-Chlamydomonas_euryale.AAC.3
MRHTTGFKCETPHHQVQQAAAVECDMPHSWVRHVTAAMLSVGGSTVAQRATPKISTPGPKEGHC